MRLARFVLASLVLAFTPLPAGAVVFVVDSINNSSDGDLSDNACRDAAAACTLRAAIQQANATPGADRIEFAIPGAGPHVIRPVPVALPAIFGDLVIDGYTQPGASENTLPIGTDAQIEIELEGTYGQGVVVDGGVVALKGLTIRSFLVGVYLSTSALSTSGSQFVGNRIEQCSTGMNIISSGIRIGGAANRDRNLISNNSTGITVGRAGNFIVNNLIGTDASGMSPIGNTQGILLLAGSNAVTDNVISGNAFGVLAGSFSTGNTLVRNLIGVSADGRFALGNSVGVRILGSGNQVGLLNLARPYANANVISANSAGLQLRSSGNSVVGNYFGTGPGGSGVIGNISAIEIEADDNVIGAPPASRGEANVIANSETIGITLRQGSGALGPPLNNSLRTNRLYGNAIFDIDLGDDRIVNNDLGDVDAGANNLQNSPTIDAVTASSGQTVIEGKLDTGFGTYTLDFYTSAACDAGDDTGSGQFFLGSDTLQVPPGVAVSFTAVIQRTAQGHAVTAMATDEFGNSSELGPCYEALIPDGADVSVNAVIDPSLAVVAPGDDVRIEVTASNAGPATATNVPVVIARPAGFDSWSSAGAGSYDEVSGLWSVGDLATGATATRVFDATIGANAAGLLTVLADAEQSLVEADPDLAGNRSSVAFDVRTGADLVVTQTVPLSAQPGESLSLEVSVRNDGPEDAIGVIVAGRLDLGFELDEASAPAGISYNPETGNWSLAVGSLALGNTATFVLPVRVAPGTPLGSGLIHTFSAHSTLGVDPAPELSAAVVAIGRRADLRISRLDNFGERWVAYVSESRDEAFLDMRILVRVDSCRMPIEIPAEPSCPASCPFTCAIPITLGLEDLSKFELQGDKNELTLQVSIESDPADPYFEVDPSDNTIAWVAQVCGLFGIEAPLLIGLVLLLRGRNGRAAFRRVFPGAAVVLAVISGGVVQTAHAAPVTFTVDSAASSATVSLASSLGSPPAAAVSLSGTATADVALANHALFGLVAESVQLSGAALELSDAAILLEAAPLYELSFAAEGIGASLSGPLVSGFAVGPGLSLFDLAGSALVFDTGFITTTGTFFGVPVNQTLDLAATPFSSIFAANSVAQVQVFDLGAGNASVRLALPFSAPLRLSVDGEPVTLTIAGTLVMNGVSVPEPPSALLLAPALLGLLSRRRVARA